MQTDESGPPSTAQKNPSEAAGGSLREPSPLVDLVGSRLRDECFRIFGSTWSYDTAWRFARVAIAAMNERPKITHDDAEMFVTRIGNFIHHVGGQYAITQLFDYIKQQRDDERRRDTEMRHG